MTNSFKYNFVISKLVAKNLLLAIAFFNIVFLLLFCYLYFNSLWVKSIERSAFLLVLYIIAIVIGRKKGLRIIVNFEQKSLFGLLPHKLRILNKKRPQNNHQKNSNSLRKNPSKQHTRWVYCLWIFGVLTIVTFLFMLSLLYELWYLTELFFCFETLWVFFIFNRVVSFAVLKNRILDFTNSTLLSKLILNPFIKQPTLEIVSEQGIKNYGVYLKEIQLSKDKLSIDRTNSVEKMINNKNVLNKDELKRIDVEARELEGEKERLYNNKISLRVYRRIKGFELLRLYNICSIYAIILAILLVAVIEMNLLLNYLNF